MQDVERIISEGRTLRKSSKVIAEEVIEYTIEELVRRFVDRNAVFFGRADIADFRKFLEDGSSKGEQVCER